MSKATNRFSPEVRERAVRMVLDNQGQHSSHWSALLSISTKIGSAPQTLKYWIKKAEVEAGRHPKRDGREEEEALERELRKEILHNVSISTQYWV